MRYFEPSGSDLASLPVYSWWFFVTATTVGTETMLLLRLEAV